MIHDKDEIYDEPIGNPEDYDNNWSPMMITCRLSEEQVEEWLKIKKEIKEELWGGIKIMRTYRCKVKTIKYAEVVVFANNKIQ